MTTFTVTNTSNATLDFSLAATQLANGQTVAFGGTDSFNQNNVRVFVDSNNNGVYDAGVDVATFIDELAADATRTVFIVSDTPAGQADASLAGVVLTATAAAGGTAGCAGHSTSSRRPAPTTPPRSTSSSPTSPARPMRCVTASRRPTTPTR